MNNVPPPTEILPADRLGRVHFVGIGGAGMSGIARIMLARSIPVSGSDAKESRALDGLRALSAVVHVGHAAEHVAHLGPEDTLVVSSAIRDDNPELVAAADRGVRVLPRAAALAAVMAGLESVAVAGTHGKTTTTSMLTVALQHCGVDPSYAIGGTLNDSGANAHHGTGPHFVAEADESDGSFLLYEPSAAIVTNVEADHLDHYGTGEAVERAFGDFVRRIRPGGFLVTCYDDPGARRLATTAREAGVDVRTYGVDPGADVRVTTLSSGADGSELVLTFGGGMSERATGEFARLRVPVPGAHNALNATAAFLTGLGLGLDGTRLAEGIAAFGGTRRRFEHKGTAAGVRVYDDYAHHPTELVATLTAARAAAGNGRLVVAFQPHRYSRTAAFRAEFGKALALADAVVVMEVYPAGEEPLPGAGGATVAAEVPLPADRVVFEPSWSAVAGRLAELARPGDLVLTMGAGDVTMIGPELLDLLGKG